MGSYYYLVAQLPYLQFGEESPISVDELLDEAQKWVTKSELALLRSIDLEETKIYGNEPEVIKQYKRFEKKLRQELVAWREARDQGTEHKPNLFRIGLLKEGTPLDVEENLLRLRWEFIKELETGLHFQFPVVALYVLKLQILKRMDTFDREVGEEKFKHYTEVSL